MSNRRQFMTLLDVRELPARTASEWRARPHALFVHATSSNRWAGL